MKVGMPVMKLDRQAHKQIDKAGNVRAVCLEGMAERAGTDPDIDRERTQHNIYFGQFRKGNDLANYYENMAKEHVVMDKNGRAKKLRTDAGVAFAGIVKPLSDEFSRMSEQEQIAFLQDSLDIVRDLYGSRGMTIDQAVIHVDEGCPHLHYYGHDQDYKLGRKLNLSLFDSLNREYPEQMRSRGWSVDGLTGWKEATAGMSDDEIEAYKASRPKKRHGRTAREYKAQREVDALEKQAEAVKLETARVEAKQRLVVRSIDRSRADLEAREKAVADREAAVEAQAQQVAQERQDAARERQEAAQERRAALAAQYTIKAHAERLDALEADIHALGKAPTARDSALLDYMKHRKNKDGVSMYDAYADKAADWQRSRQQQQRHAIQAHRDAVPAAPGAGRRLPNIRMPETGDDYEFTR